MKDQFSKSKMQFIILAHLQSTQYVLSAVMAIQWEPKESVSHFCVDQAP